MSATPDRQRAPSAGEDGPVPGGAGVPPDAALRAALDAALLEAHAGGDVAALAALYRRAADLAEGEGEDDACCFFLTQAWVFALDAGDAVADALHDRLAVRGRA